MKNCEIFVVLLYPTWIQSVFHSLCFLSVWPPRGHATQSRELLANRSGGFKRVSVVMAAEPRWQARLQWLKVNSHWTRVTIKRRVNTWTGRTKTNDVNVSILHEQQTKALLLKRPVSKHVRVIYPSTAVQNPTESLPESSVTNYTLAACLTAFYIHCPGVVMLPRS